MAKSTTPVVVETKAEMIAQLIGEGKTNPEIKKAVMEVYATCYSSEIDRKRKQLAANK